jgi:hypothetical protein
MVIDGETGLFQFRGFVFITVVAQEHFHVRA